VDLAEQTQIWQNLVDLFVIKLKSHNQKKFPLAFIMNDYGWAEMIDNSETMMRQSPGAISDLFSITNPSMFDGMATDPSTG